MNVNDVKQIQNEAHYFSKMGDADKDEVLQWVKTGTMPKGKFGR